MMNPVMLQDLEISVTSGCNLRCRHCSVMPARARRPSDLSLIEIVRVLNEARVLGARFLDLTGGEPLVRMDLEQIVHAAKKLGFWTKLLTNGTLLTHDRLHSLHDAGLDAVAVSVDGSTSEVHARTRNTPPDLFERTIEAARTACLMGLPTKFNTVVSRANLEDLPKVTALAQQLGCFEHRICSLVPTGWGTAWFNQAVDPATWFTFVKERLAPLDTTMPIYVSLASLPTRETRCLETGCLVPQAQRMHVSATGDLHPCPFFGFARRSMGNIREAGLRSIVTDSHAWQRACSDAQLVCPEIFRSAHGTTMICPCRKIRARTLA